MKANSEIWRLDDFSTTGLKRLIRDASRPDSLLYDFLGDTATLAFDGKNLLCVRQGQDSLRCEMSANGSGTGCATLEIKELALLTQGIRRWETVSATENALRMGDVSVASTNQSGFPFVSATKMFRKRKHLAQLDSVAVGLAWEFLPKKTSEKPALSNQGVHVLVRGRGKKRPLYRLHATNGYILYRGREMALDAELPDGFGQGSWHVPTNLLHCAKDGRSWGKTHINVETGGSPGDGGRTNEAWCARNGCVSVSRMEHVEPFRDVAKDSFRRGDKDAVIEKIGLTDAGTIIDLARGAIDDIKEKKKQGGFAGESVSCIFGKKPRMVANVGKAKRLDDDFLCDPFLLLRALTPFHGRVDVEISTKNGIAICKFERGGETTLLAHMTHQAWASEKPAK